MTAEKKIKIVRLANDYFATLLYSGKISRSQSSEDTFVLSSEVRASSTNADQEKEEADKILKQISEARAKTS